MLFAAALLCAACGYYSAVLAAVFRFRRRGPTAATDRPPVTLLKPAHGADERFEKNLRSHAAQDYPALEILVGVSAGDRATAGAVAKVAAEFPRVRIEAIECPPAPEGVNAKVHVLEELARHARNDVWVVSDADVAVPAGYLDSLAAELARPEVGMVTCLYRAEATGGFAGELEALWINAEFAGQVLLADLVQGMNFALGATMAFRREAFETTGGFAALRPFLGDDFHLGARFAAAGYGVRIAPTVVTTRLPSAGWQAVWTHQLRWSRTIRAQRPWGHLGLAVTFGTLWALAALLWRPEELWPLALSLLGLRFMAAAVSSAVGGSRFGRGLLLLPLADLAAFVVWLGSFFSRQVSWAGKGFRLGPRGRIEPPGP